MFTLTTGAVTLGDPITDPNTGQVITGCIGGRGIQSNGIALGGGFGVSGNIVTNGDFIAINQIISGTGTNSHGVNFAGSSTILAVGNIKITATTRGTTAGLTSSGIAMQFGGAQILISGAGNPSSITLIGIASSAPAPNNTIGLDIRASPTPGIPIIRSSAGDIHIAGYNPQVGATGGSACNLSFGTSTGIQSTSGNITLSGINNSTSANTQGVSIFNAWTPTTTGTITFGGTVTDGTVTVTGCQGGAGSGSHGVTFNAAMTFAQPVIFTNVVGGGSIGGSGNGVNLTSLGSITTSSSITIPPGGCISSTGANCIGASFAGDVTSTGGGSILINAASQGSSGTCPGIQLVAKTMSTTGSGAITLNGTGSPTGNSSSYGVTVTGANAHVTSVNGDITFGSTGTGTAAQAYLGGTGVTNVSTTGTGSIHFAGAYLDSTFVPIISSKNNVSFSQAVILNASDSTIDITGGSGNLTFSSTISGTTASSHNLTLLAGAGTTTVLGAVDLSGQASPLTGGALLVTGGGPITFADITTAGNPTLIAAGPSGGPVSITSSAGSVSVGNITTSGATGSVTGGNAGNITLQPASTFTSGSLGNIPDGILTLKGNLTAIGGGPAGIGGAISLSPTGRTALMSIATIASSFAGNDVTITGGSVTTGPIEAMTILGNLTMNVTGSITVTDLIALDAITLTATTLTQQAGTAGFLLDSMGNLDPSSESHIASPVSITLNISGIQTINGVIVLVPGTTRASLTYVPSSYVLNTLSTVTPPTTPVPISFSIAEQIFQLVVANTQMELYLPDPWHRTFDLPWMQQWLFDKMPPDEKFRRPTFRQPDRNI